MNDLKEEFNRIFQDKVSLEGSLKDLQVLEERNDYITQLKDTVEIQKKDLQTQLSLSSLRYEVLQKDHDRLVM